MLARLVLLTSVAVGNGLPACVEHPLETWITPSHVMSGNPRKVLTTVAQQHGICLGIEGAAGLPASVSIPAGPVTFGGLLHGIAPGYLITLRERVVALRDRPHAARTWLDYPLDFSTSRRLDAQLLVHILLPGTLLAKADRKNGGIAGDFRPSHEELGPYHFTKTPIRAILAQLLRDSIKGGMWFVPGEYPLSPVAPTSICELVLYSEPIANAPARF